MPMQVWYKLMAFNLETLTEEEPAEGHWAQVISELRLSPEQMKSCKAAMHIFTEQVRARMHGCMDAHAAGRPART